MSCNIPEDSHLHTPRHKNIRSYQSEKEQKGKFLLIISGGHALCSFAVLTATN
jgi:hypothetical protein